MLTRTVRLLMVFIWVVAAALSFVLVSQRNDSAPLPATSLVTATTWSGSATAHELRDSLLRYSREHQVTFAQEVADFDDGGAVRHLYLADGDPAVDGGAWLTDGIGDFGGSTTTHVHPLAQLGERSPLGNYNVFGDPVKARAFASFLSDQGLEARAVSISKLGALSRSVVTALAVVALLVVSLVGAHVVAGTRRYAVSRLHGDGYGAMLLEDLRRLAPTWLVAGLVTLTGVGLAAGLRDGAGVPLYLVTTGRLALLLLAIAATAYGLVLAMIVSVDLEPALKGRLPAGALTFTAYGLRITAAVVALGAVATSLTLAADLRDRDASVDAFQRLGDLSTLTLGNAYNPEDQADLNSKVGPWLRDVDAQGGLLIAAQEVLGGEDPTWRGSTVLVVNDAFLADQPVRLAEGGRLSPADLTGVTVAVPDDYWNDRDRLGPVLGLDTQLRPEAGTEHASVRLAPHQKLFTYTPASGTGASTQAWGAVKSVVTDPVLVIVPSANGLLTDDSYASIASQQEALLTDPRAAASKVHSDPGLERFVRGITPVADTAARTVAADAADLRSTVFTAVAGCLVVLMTGVAAALVHTRRMAQRLVVRHLNGWSFIATHRRALAVEAVVLTAVVAWIPWHVLSERRALAAWAAAGPLPVDPPDVTPGEWAGIAVLVGLTAGGFLLALHATHRRALRTGTRTA